MTYAQHVAPSENRIRELVAQIDAEKDSEKVKILAAELEQLLTAVRTNVGAAL